MFDTLSIAVEVVYTLTIGAALFAPSAMSRIAEDSAALITGGVCIVGFVCGGHVWLSGLRRTFHWRWRWTLALAAVVLAGFVSSVCLTGIIHQFVWLSNERIATRREAL